MENPLAQNPSAIPTFKEYRNEIGPVKEVITIAAGGHLQQKVKQAATEVQVFRSEVQSTGDAAVAR